MRARACTVVALLALLAGCSPAPADKPAAKAEAPRPVMRALAAVPPPPPPAIATVADAAPKPPPDTGPARPVPDAALPEDLPPSNAVADPVPFPPAVTAFMVDRDGCDHFRGEEPYDEDRRMFLEDNIRELCTGSDARLAALRRRYADNPDVTAALAPYEDRIEPDAAP